jgi:hypothetical protein
MSYPKISIIIHLHSPTIQICFINFASFILTFAHINMATIYVGEERFERGGEERERA